MKYTLLICWLLCGLAPNLSWAVNSPLGTTAKPAPHAVGTVVGLTIQIIPASSTCSVGQSLTAVVTGGQEGTTYALAGLENSSINTPMTSVTIVNEQGGTNTVTWQNGQTQAVFLVSFLDGSEGDGRVLQVTETTPNGTDMATSGELTIIPRPVLTLSPALSTYSVGQSLTVTMTGGIPGRDYIIKVYSSVPADLDNDVSGDITPSTSQSTVNYITWQDGQTPKFYIRLDKGSMGSNRYFLVTDLEFNHVGISAPFTICPGAGSGLAQVGEVSVLGTLGPDNCSVRVQTKARGNAFVFTGPNGYVFSNVYREVGDYTVFAPITQPGTYTLTATYDNYCGKSSVTKTFDVTGTACK